MTIIAVYQTDLHRSEVLLGTLLWKPKILTTLPNCPECFAREKRAIQAKYADKEDVDFNEINALIEKIEIPMKMDMSTKHFICKKCGLYATREQLGDIRERLNRKDQTREDKQYDYLEWWQKSKKEKQKA